MTGALVLLALALSADSFRVSIGLGAARMAAAGAARLVLAFAFCDAFALAVGLALGRSFVSVVGPWAGGLGPPALAAYALYVLWIARRSSVEEAPGGWLVLGLPLTLSLDNLVVGGTLGGQPVSALVLVPLVGTASGLLALAGLALGRSLARSLPVRPELAGGALLLVVSVLALRAELP